ncbi:LamB/YcsF family protein [Pelagibius sp. CAU 1746]|uniref:LamB/YcsF family protein n=1 Tax=Pelagibius sp. CAU 1746 TaxID=3140370 RepID=UPI00325A5E42
MPVDINCDMGESFGLYKMGDDEGMMPYITQANVACGFHGSDPNHMRRTVELALAHGVKVGAHFSLPDLPGFGRREMKIDREEMANIIIYQVGALKGFLEAAGMTLSHMKPHGALYGMAAQQEPIAHAVADVAEIYKVPVLGMAATLHEQVCADRGISFQAEFFADLGYDDDGRLLITRKHDAVDPGMAAARCVQAVREGAIKSINGKSLSVRAETICVHSDTPNAIDVAKAVRKAVSELEAA